MRNRHWSFAAATVAAVLGAACPGSVRAGPLPAPWGDRASLIASFEQMPDAELRNTFFGCDRESSLRPLGFSEGVYCAMAWDTLLKRSFGGNVDKLLEWWRAWRDAAASPAARVAADHQSHLSTDEAD